jgi:3-methyladenine DNA glycosylase AlkD
MNIVNELREELKKNADEKTLATSQNFFRERIHFHGVKVPVVNRISREFFSRINTRPKSEIFGYCDELWQSGYLEESFVACNWSYYIRKLYDTVDFEVFESWIGKYVNNWASCDTLCNHSVGTFLEMYPLYIGRLMDFCMSDNRWKRRAAAVSLIIPARKGLFRQEIFEIAARLLSDDDDLVRKGYGWLLKAAGDYDQQSVFDFIMENRLIMPRVSLRYAIEKMPPEMKKMCMNRSI